MEKTSITITDEVYQYLKSIKGKRSFSETILGLSSSKEEVIQFAGALKEADLDSVENVREEINKSWSNRS